MSRAGAIVLWETNTGARYQEHCEAARMSGPRAARRFVGFAIQGWREMVTQEDFTPGDAGVAILQAAAELLAYYQRHNAESDALARADGAT